MPIIKNISDEAVSGIVGVGLVEPGEIKTVSDVPDHPSLKVLSDDEATKELEAIEHKTAAPALPSTPLPPAQPPTPPTPPAPPVNNTPPVPPAAPAQPPANNNVSSQGA